MKNIKLIKVLKLLSKKKLIKLKDFINNPYFNKDKKVGILIEYLITYAPNYEITKEDCFQEIFPNKTYDSLTFRRLTSKTLKLVEKYIWIEEGEQKPHIQHKLLTTFYRENQVLAEQQLVLWDKSIKKTMDWDYQVIEYLFMAFERFIIALVDKGKKIASYKTKQDVVKALKDLEDAFIQVVLRYIVLIGISHFTTKINPVLGNPSTSSKVIDDLLEYVMNNKEQIIKKFNNKPMVFQCLLAYDMICNNNPRAYQALKEMINKEDNNIPKSNQKNSLQYLLQYGYLSDMSLIEMHSDGLDIYKIMLERDLIFFNGYIFPVMVSNITTMALTLGEIEWVENFLKKYLSRLPKNDIFHISETCFMLLSFKKKEFEKSLTHINNLEQQQSHMYNLKARRYQIMAYYELNDERIDMVINSLKVMLSRNKKQDTNEQKKTRLFVNTVNRLIYIRNKDKEKLLILKNEINESYRNGDWLLEKIEEKMNK